MALLSTTPLSVANSISTETGEYLKVKELIFEYLIHYARERSDLSLLCINAFDKDSRSSDPGVRAMSLRFISQLKFVQT